MNADRPKPLESIEDLAAFGAPPFFAEPVHVGQPNIGDRARLFERLNEILDHRRLTNMGPYEREFEERLAGFLGVRHAVATCNGTLALQLAVRALGLTGEVLMPSFTFIATAHAVRFQEITPVFCDVIPGTFLIDPEDAARRITPRTSAIMGVHVFGRPCDADALAALAERHNLHLLFDAAHAFGCTHGGRPVGAFGDAEVFSFHATKFINAFEGGAVTTDDDALAERLRLLRNFGFVDYDTVIGVGTNGKMSEISAAMGLTSLEAMDSIMAHNYANYQRYKHQLRNLEGLTLLAYDEDEKRNYQYIILDVDADAYGLTRDQILCLCHEENVLARRYFYPGCHRMAPYGAIGDADGALPHTEAMCGRVLALPTGTGVSLDTIDAICRLLAFWGENASEVSHRLRLRAKKGHPDG